jgi:hypothetical protein
MPEIDSPDRERRLIGSLIERPAYQELYLRVGALEERVRILDAQYEALLLSTPLRPPRRERRQDSGVKSA